MNKVKKKYIVGLIVIIFLCLGLMKCNNSDNDDPNISNKFDEKIVDDKLVFYTYEEVYVYYSMLEENKGVLNDEIVELILATNPNEMNQQGYAKYYGDFGRRLLAECQKFKRVIYAGGGDKELARHVYNYQYFYTNNQEYYDISIALINIEKELNQNKYDKVLNNIKIINEKTLKLGEFNNENNK